MKYINQLNAYWNWVKLNPLPSRAGYLYFAILDCANTAGWKREFNAPNSTLQAMAGLDKNGLSRNRNILIQQGLIEYRQGNRGNTGTYRIVPLYGNQNDTQDDTQSEPKAIPKAIPKVRTYIEKEKEKDNVPPISSLREEVRAAFEALQVPDDAKTTHALVSSTLSELGFDVKNEYPVPDRGDGRNGRIDVFAEKNGYRLAIEIDRLSPRQKSVIKLKSLDDCDRIILLRDHDGRTFYCDIPVIVLRMEKGQQDDRFDSFWNLYPKKKAKADARKAWDKLKPDGELYTAIMRSLSRQKESPDWTKEGGQYAPYPATWLRGRRWEDEETPVAPPKKDKLLTLEDIYGRRGAERFRGGS